MKLTRGVGSKETGGCWMAVNHYYENGSLDWNDQPSCVCPVIRALAITLNDRLIDGERERLIGPHLFTTMGTRDDSLMPKRVQMAVRFALDCAADALDGVGVKHDLREDFGEDYSAAWYAAEYAAGYAAGSAGYAAGYAAWSAGSAGYAAESAAESAAEYAGYAGSAAGYAAGYAAESAERLLQLILDMCALSTPVELDAGKRTEALRVVCGVTA